MAKRNTAQAGEYIRATMSPKAINLDNIAERDIKKRRLLIERHKRSSFWTSHVGNTAHVHTETCPSTFKAVT